MNQVKVSHYERITNVGTRLVGYRAVYLNGTSKTVTAAAAGIGRKAGYEIKNVALIPADWEVRFLPATSGQSVKSRGAVAEGPHP